ncbi:hypothetical protein KGA65_14675 [Ideonella sp. B7]|uniref:hypothetical protein n=1 Tax=Ideonella benzenivorans TaxID=2831643 RepID=UPI001CEDAABC|nr:hypothetical protein [Ideonella benzenivorans]MCA6217778.1 hypothetical protein [Ideonella benzenivorans]
MPSPPKPVATLDCQTLDGRTIFVTVAKEGRLYHLSAPGERSHICHPSVSSLDGVRREILLVYRARVVPTI